VGTALISQAAEAQPSLARAASQLGAVEAQLEAVRGELADARLSAETEAAGELLVREEAARLRGELEAGEERAGRAEAVRARRARLGIDEPPRGGRTVSCRVGRAAPASTQLRPSCLGMSSLASQ
jgi:hypothetical protein